MDAYAGVTGLVEGATGYIRKPSNALRAETRSGALPESV
jgi:hypothetical protein